MSDVKSETSKNRKRWSKEETIIAFALYKRLSYHEIDKKNQHICDIARLLNRTPSAVVMKLFNIGTYDPEHKCPPLPNTSKMDIEIWTDFAEWGDTLIKFGEFLENQKRSQG